MSKDKSKPDGYWYSNADWDPEAQEFFWRKFKAARDAKHWAAIEKSGRLWFSGLKDEARSLLDRAELLAPDRVDTTEQRARFAFDEGDLTTAERYYRAADQSKSLAMVLARDSDPAKKNASRRLLAEWYDGNSCPHLATWDQSIAQVGPVLFDDFSHLAETLVMIHSEHRPKDDPLAAMDAKIEDELASRHFDSVRRLDEYFRILEMPGLSSGVYQPNHPTSRWAKDFLLQKYVPALGAYLGQMLVKHCSGVWQNAQPIPASVVTIGSTTLDPFRQAFDVVFYYARCMELIDETTTS